MPTKFLFRIDTKSLYFGIVNDNDKGHTATVSTNLLQGPTQKPELSLFQTHESNWDISHADGLVKECLKNSKAECRITNVLVYDEIFVNGLPVNTGKQFCLFLKEEIDSKKYHCGRIKIHYPISLSYSDERADISNKDVLKAIQEKLQGFAYIVKGFEIGPGRRINFLATLIGEAGIVYSKVFLNYKGVAERKFTDVFNEQADSYDFEIFKMKKASIPGIETIEPGNYAEALKYCKKTAKSIVYERLREDGRDRLIDCVSDEYPYGLYDFEVRENGGWHCYIVAFTTTRMTYFFLSNAQYRLMNSFPNRTTILLVKDVLSDNYSIEEYRVADFENLNKSLSMIKFSQ